MYVFETRARRSNKPEQSFVDAEDLQQPWATFKQRRAGSSTHIIATDRNIIQTAQVLPQV
jgi:hypothetical protein